MIESNVYELIEQYSKILRLDLTSEEFARLVADKNCSEESIQTTCELFHHLAEKKQATTVHTLLKMSRLPLKNPKTFENFDFSVIKGRDVERLKNVSSLSAVYAHRNLAFIGPAGTGKTHLAQAFGYECCQQGLKTYFIKASELRDKLTNARKAGKTVSCLNSLVRPSCLIIDEIGHCEFDRENTRLFFDLVDRRYNKEGSFNTVFTSNKDPARWRDIFNEDERFYVPLTASLMMLRYLKSAEKVSGVSSW